MCAVILHPAVYPEYLHHFPYFVRNICTFQIHFDSVIVTWNFHQNLQNMKLDCCYSVNCFEETFWNPFLSVHKYWLKVVKFPLE